MEGASTAGGMIGARERRAQRRAATWCSSATTRAPRTRCSKASSAVPIAPTLARRLDKMRGRAISTAALKSSANYLAAAENLARIRAS